jgi:hypothetical protein
MKPSLLKKAAIILWARCIKFQMPGCINLHVPVTINHSVAYGVKSLDECRRWAAGQAIANNDPYFSRSSYLCWIGKTGEEFAGMPVYRTNAR